MAVGSTGSFDNHSDTQGSTQTPPITFIQRMYADKEDEEEIVTRKQKKARKKKKKTPKLATTAAAADTQHPNHQPQEQEQEPVHQPQEQEQEPVHQEQEPVHQEQEQEQEPVHQKQEQEPVHQPQEQEQEPVHQEQEQEPVHQKQEQEQEPVHQEQEQELYPEKEEPSKEPVTCTSTEIIKTEPVITMGTGTEETDGGTGTADGGTDARMIISDADKRASDIVIDETTRLVLSLDVLSEDNEQPLRVSYEWQLYVLIPVQCFISLCSWPHHLVLVSRGLLTASSQIEGSTYWGKVSLYYIASKYDLLLH